MKLKKHARRFHDANGKVIMNKSEINIFFEDQQPSKGFEYKGDMFYKQPYFKCNCGTNFNLIYFNLF